MASTIAPPLSWVKPEVDHALKAVRDSIAQFMAAPEEPAVLKKCPEQLHQVTGALHILGLSGAMGFCESMEHAFAGVNAGPIAKKSTISVLDRAVLALKEFIDGLSKGEANAPIKLFPVYREISTLQGKTEVTEKDLFFPDLALDAPLHPAAQVVTKDKLPALLQAQRSRYQRGLLAWLRSPSESQGLQEMRQALETLDIIANQLPHPRALWWVAIGLIDGLLHAGKDEWSTAAKALCSKLDLRMRDLAAGKTSGDDHLLRDMLFAIAKCKPATPRLREIRQQYQLDSLFPEPDLPGFMEYDMDWLEPALNEARSRIEAIKSVWVQYISGESGALQRFRESVTELKTKINDRRRGCVPSSVNRPAGSSCRPRSPRKLSVTCSMSNRCWTLLPGIVRNTPRFRHCSPISGRYRGRWSYSDSGVPLNCRPCAWNWSHIAPNRISPKLTAISKSWSKA